jgi:hypothetical protein
MTRDRDRDSHIQTGVMGDRTEREADKAAAPPAADETSLVEIESDRYEIVHEHATDRNFLLPNSKAPLQ